MRRILFGFLAFAFFALVWVSCDTKARCTPQLRNAAKLVRTSADGERDTISIQDSIRVGDTIRMSLFANGLYNYLTSLTVASEPEMSVSLEWSEEMSHCLASDADPAKGRLLFVPEEVYEASDDDMFFLEDRTATIEEKERLVKYRKIDRSIIRMLKEFYDYRDEISGEKIGEPYGDSVVEAHHIDYFTRSQNNDSTNIIIISPNYHRIIHKNNPHFNRKKYQFEFENGEVLRLKLYEHLKV